MTATLLGFGSRDLDRIRGYLPDLWEGLKVTVTVAVLAAVLGLCIGSLVAVASQSRSRPLRMLVHLYVGIGRVVPELIQVFVWYYVLPDFGLTLSPYQAGVIAIGVSFGPFVAEVLRAGIESVPSSQWEASTVLGLSRRRVWLRVIMPQATRHVYPVLSGYIISIFKATSLLSFISLREVFAVSRNLAALNFRYVELFALVMVIYLLLALPTAFGLKLLSRRLFRW